MSAPAQKTGAAWNDAGLEEDVATFSYEHALRTHARHRLPDSDAQMLKRAPDPGSIRIREATPAEVDSAGQSQRSNPPARCRSHAEAGVAQVVSHALDLNLKRASITVRLSSAEIAQLRMRANDAGLTVSGYLRSCTFEAEALRAQVKQALAELRTDKPKQDQAGLSRVRRSWVGWLLRPFAFRHGTERIARV